MKTRAKTVFTIFVLAGVLIGLITLIVYLLTWLFKDIWQFFTEPGLSNRLTEMFRGFLETIGALGLCCIGIVILIIIVGNIPYKWWHGGLEPSGDDDDPYYRYM
jgi:hypothetical protein